MLRLGTVPYLNALPLVEDLAGDPDLSLLQDVPASLVRHLRAGALDLALVSAVELFRRPALGWIAGPAITSAGPVRSILLFLSVPPGRVRTLGLDTSSRSAAVLARVCLARFLGAGEVDERPAPPDCPLDALPADAVLRIGDPALRTDPGGREVLDLGELWTARTGLPFVYALWLGAPGTPAATLGPRLCRARDRGRGRLATIASRFAREHAMDEASCRRYLEECIGYELGERELEGLALFGHLAHELGLVDEATLPPALV